MVSLWSQNIDWTIVFDHCKYQSNRHTRMRIPIQTEPDLLANQAQVKKGFSRNPQTSSIISFEISIGWQIGRRSNTNSNKVERLKSKVPEIHKSSNRNRIAHHFRCTGETRGSTTTTGTWEDLGVGRKYREKPGDDEGLAEGTEALFIRCCTREDYSRASHRSETERLRGRWPMAWRHVEQGI